MTWFGRSALVEHGKTLHAVGARVFVDIAGRRTTKITTAIGLILAFLPNAPQPAVTGIDRLTRVPVLPHSARGIGHALEIAAREIATKARGTRGLIGGQQRIASGEAQRQRPLVADRTHRSATRTSWLFGSTTAKLDASRIRVAIQAKTHQAHIA